MKKKIVKKFAMIYNSRILDDFSIENRLDALKLIYSKDIKDNNILKKISRKTKF